MGQSNKSEKNEQMFDLAIALSLSDWPALTLAVQNEWGGPQSSEKRDWFAGAISDLMASNTNADEEYIEEFLLQVMNDEFEVIVEDGSAEEVAVRILGLRKLTLQGDFGAVEEMREKWETVQRHGQTLRIQHVESMEQEADLDTDGSTEEDADDLEMDDAPNLVSVPHEKLLPEVDEDGFIKVIGKRRR